MTFSYTLSEMALMCDAQMAGAMHPALMCTHVITDSRSHFDPEGGVFFAIRGAYHDGHLFLSDLAARGVICFVVEQLPVAHDTFPEVAFLLVQDTLKALQLFASNHRLKFKMTVLGVTGSNGKTIVKEWLAQMLSHDFSVIRSPLSYNSQLGVPLSVLQMQECHQIAIIEAGISQPGEMEHLAGIIKPDIGIFTGLGPAHDEHFCCFKEKAEEKFKLFSSCRTVICFNDDKEVFRYLKDFSTLHHIRLFTLGKKGNPDLKYRVTGSEFGHTFLEISNGKELLKVTIPFVDDASISNALLSFGTMVYLGVPKKIVAERLKLLEPVAMRMEQVEGIRNTIIINDSYNNDLLALKIAINHLKNNNVREGKSIILSDIFQSGLDQGTMVREIVGLVNGSKAGKFIGIGSGMAALRGQIHCKSWFYDTTAQFLQSHPSHLFHDEVILLKGARRFRFERIRDLLQKKSHDTILEINLGALVHNLNCFRTRLSENTRIMAMVKASSYGGGTFEIANTLQFHRVDYLAVAYSDEGVELREAGITLPIMVMNAERSAFETMIDHSLEPELYSFSMLNDFLDALKKRGGGGGTAYPIHIEIDTGMHRLGFAPADTDKLVEWLNDATLVTPRSIFSHLATADMLDDDGFAEKQIAAFDVVKVEMLQRLKAKPWFHILNSAGIIRFTDAQYDMVRPGIGLYGISPFPKFQQELKHIGRLRTTISQLREVPAGDSVGYNRSFVAGKAFLMAVAAIGYADGFNRKLGNGVGKVWVRGREVPVMGDVCMDMMMLDVSGVENVSEGDEVVVFDGRYPVGEIAGLLKTIPYEVLTSVSSRVKRVFLSDEQG